MNIHSGNETYSKYMELNKFPSESTAWLYTTSVDFNYDRY